MANGKTTHPPQNAALTATRSYDPKQDRQLTDGYDRLLKEAEATKRLAIFWVTLLFLLACYLAYNYIIYVVLR